MTRSCRPVRGAGAVLAIATFVAAGCAPSGDPGATDADTLTVFGPYRGVEADRFVESLAPFTEQTGIVVRYTGTADFVPDLLDRIGEERDPPDVAMVPQPGLVRQLAQDGQIVELAGDANIAIGRNYTPTAAALGDVDGIPYGVPFRVEVKSLVWYRPSVFAEHGWDVPATFDELTALTDRIAAEDGIDPWCLTLQAGSATGWPATDWVEDLVLRFAGPDAYQRWADGELTFDAPEIRRAFDRFRELVLVSGHLFGGATYAIDRATSSVFEPLMSVEPGCAMAKQGDFAVSWLPDGTVVGPDGDVDWFVLPNPTAGAEPPLVVGGDLVVQFRRDDRVDALMAFLAGGQSGVAWARRGGLISARSTFDAAEYPDDTTRAIADLFVSADVVAFDASDLMPPDVGTTPYWTGITEWIAGRLTLDQLVTALDRRYAEFLNGGVDLPSPGNGS